MDFYSYHHEILEDGVRQYTFYSNITKRIYSVSFDSSFYAEFSEIFPHLLSNGHSIAVFSFATEELDGASQDDKVKNTIFQVILTESRLPGNENTVFIYHCDPTDDRQKARNVLFEKWFQETTNHQNLIVKSGIEVDIPVKEGENIPHYLGYLTSANNPNAEQISREFNSFLYMI